MSVVNSMVWTLSKLGLVWDIHQPPEQVLALGRKSKG